MDQDTKKILQLLINAVRDLCVKQDDYTFDDTAQELDEYIGASLNKAQEELNKL